MTAVVAPCAGTLRPLAQAPDPVFAAEMLGAGVALDPSPGAASDGIVTVVAPVSGRVAKAHPHAVAIVADDGVGVLLHLGIDTVGLKGEGFDLLVATGDTVTAGSDVVRWSPTAVEARGLSPWVLLCVFDTKPGAIVAADGRAVEPGDELFTWPDPGH